MYQLQHSVKPVSLHGLLPHHRVADDGVVPLLFFVGRFKTAGKALAGHGCLPVGVPLIGAQVPAEVPVARCRAEQALRFAGPL